MCFDEPFDGVYLAFSDSSSVGRTTTAIAVIEGVTGSSPCICASRGTPTVDVYTKG